MVSLLTFAAIYDLRHGYRVTCEDGAGEGTAIGKPNVLNAYHICFADDRSSVSPFHNQCSKLCIASIECRAEFFALLVVKDAPLLH